MKFKAFGIAAFAFMTIIPAAHASTISTDSATIFAASTTGGVLGNFDDVPTDNIVSSTQSFGGFTTLAGYASLQGVSFTTPNAGGVVNVNSAGFNGSWDLPKKYAVNSVFNAGTAPDTLVITLPHAETAFALDYDSLFSSTTATFTLSNGFTTSAVTPSTLGVTDFIGFISDTPFTTITLTVPNDQSWVVADFIQANAVVATPLPASWSMMLTALLALGGLSYRRSKNRA